MIPRIASWSPAKVVSLCAVYVVLSVLMPVLAIIVLVEVRTAEYGAYAFLVPVSWRTALLATAVVLGPPTLFTVLWSRSRR